MKWAVYFLIVIWIWQFFIFTFQNFVVFRICIIWFVVHTYLFLRIMCIPSSRNVLNLIIEFMAFCTNNLIMLMFFETLVVWRFLYHLYWTILTFHMSALSFLCLWNLIGSSGRLLFLFFLFLSLSIHLSWGVFRRWLLWEGSLTLNLNYFWV